MTDEQKIKALQAILGQGAQVQQINFGNGTQNFYMGMDKEGKHGFACESEVVEAEVVEEESEDVTKSGSFALPNLIFSPRLFDSTTRLEQLRETIACAISWGEDYKQSEGKNEFTLNLSQKSEWYYLMQAFVEAEITRSVPSVPDLYKQMKAWFPEIAMFEEGNTKEEFVTKLTKSISAEKTKWKEMGTDKGVPLKEMMIKNQASERMKPERARDLYKAAYTGLCVKLKGLKAEFSSANDGRR